MKKTSKLNERCIKEKNENDRIVKAKESFLKMQKEIAPFIKRKSFKQHSTIGKWRETENLYFI